MHSVMGKNHRKDKFECAEPLSMIPAVPGTSWAVAVVQMGWMEEPPGGKAELALQTLWLKWGSSLNSGSPFPD